jgi:hypothetical protein
MRIFYLLISLLITAVMSINLSAEERNAYSAEAISAFAGTLIHEKEYHRAYIELLRLKAYYPDYVSDERAAVSAMYLSYKNQNFTGKFSDPLIENSRLHVSVSDIYRIFAYDSFIEKNKMNDAALALDPFRVSTEPDLETFLNKRKYHALLARGQIEEAGNFIYQIGLDERFNEITAFAIEKNSKKKSRTAAAAAGVVPGMGFWYAGQKETGIVALIVIAVSAGASYMAFSTGNDGIGLFTASISTFFYLGSIAGGYSSAEKYNSFLDSDINGYASDKLKLNDDREYIMKRYGAWPDGK